MPESSEVQPNAENKKIAERPTLRRRLAAMGRALTLGAVIATISGAGTDAEQAKPSSTTQDTFNSGGLTYDTQTEKDQYERDTNGKYTLTPEEITIRGNIVERVEHSKDPELAEVFANPNEGLGGMMAWSGA